MGLGLIGAALVGGLGGAGGAVAESATEEIKQESLAKREAMLTKIRQQEHAANKASDMKMAEEQAAKERARKAEIFGSAEKITREKAGGIVNTASATYESDEGPGEAAATTTVNRQPTSAQRAEALMEAGGKAGDFEVVKEGVRQKEVARKEEKDDAATSAANRLADIKEKELAIKDKDAETNRLKVEQQGRKIDAYLGRASSGSATEKETAEIANARFRAKAMFGYDSKRGGDEEPGNREALAKAMVFRQSTQDKPRDERITETVKELRADPKHMTTPYEELLKIAGKIVDEMRAENEPSRGGLKSPTGNETGRKPAGGKPWERNWGGKQ